MELNFILRYFLYTHTHKMQDHNQGVKLYPRIAKIENTNVYLV